MCKLFSEDGKSFGELALLKKDCIRNASIITDTTTELLVVNRQLYNRCIRESQEKEFRAKQQVCKLHDLLCLMFDGRI